MSIALALHVLFAAIWVGGMFFAYACLRPSLCALDEAARARLWVQVLGRFFFWVRTASAVILLSGVYMIRALGGIKAMPPYVHLMLALGIVMMMIFLHVYFAPFRRLGRAVDAGNIEQASAQIRQIRVLVAVNLAVGLLVMSVAAAGRYLHS